MNSLPLVARRAGYDRPHRRRSRNGCLTCKRRKVRCNEQRPHCFHCQRLGLECQWQDAAAAAPRLPSPPGDAQEGPAATTPGSSVSAAGAGLDTGWPTPAGDLFDFAQLADPAGDFSLFQDIFLPELCDPAAPRQRPLQRADPGPSSPLAAAPRQPLPPNPDAEDALLQHAPPIPDPVENGPMCASLRALLDGMAAASPMVRHAIAAFAAVQFFTSGERVDYRVYYDKAARELAEGGSGAAAGSNELRYVLTTVFFLTYINVRPLSSFRMRVLVLARFVRSC